MIEQIDMILEQTQDYRNKTPRKGKILVVGESHLETQLKDAYAIVSVQNGDQATQVLATDETIDLVIADYGLPDMTGIDLLRRVRDLEGPVGFIIRTENTADLIGQAWRDGADNYLPTDSNTLDLLLQVRNTIDKVETERARHSEVEEWRRRATRDELTGLLNAGQCEEMYKQAVHQATQRGGYAAVISVDLQNFKAMNDKHGHTAGDTILQDSADVLSRVSYNDVRNETRDYLNRNARDVVWIRKGGDEYIGIFVGQKQDRSDLVGYLHRLYLETGDFVHEINEHFNTNFGVNIGVSADATNYKTHLERADHAVYLTKALSKRLPLEISPTLRQSIIEEWTIHRPGREALYNRARTLVEGRT